MKRKAVTLTEVLIALAVGVIILLPTTAMFSTSSRLMEKSSNLALAAGIGRYIIQGMMTMETDEIKSIEMPGVSMCDTSSKNQYFQTLFELKDTVGDLKKGKVTMSMKNCPKFYTRLARYEYRYFIKSSDFKSNDVDDDIMKSV
ncbi:MAG: prepilin-type N-terminal cleavage/methylation domain-containing protein, partial [Candidatus Riflebacteria bacterium]|nr:prepilin-type N-terminal cleavage/methylation domain-containing protein [Candidatus Riflebacteria bacterium]